jgi:DNA-binding MarR family transcriptional regulator
LTRASAAPEPAEGTAEVSVVLERLGSWLRRAAPAVEWSSAALSTLDLLARLGPQRITDLVAAEHITQPGMTGLVGRMAAAGLVTRAADPTDGRATLVSVTSTGLDYLARIHEARARTIAEQISRLSPAHVQSLVDAGGALEALAAAALEPLAAQPLIPEDHPA